LIAAVATMAALFVIAPVARAIVPSCAAADVGLTSLSGPNFDIDNGAAPLFTSAYTGYQVTNSTGVAMTDTWVSLSNFTGGHLALASGQPAAGRISSLSNGSAKPLFWYLTASSATATAQGFTINVYNHRPGSANATVLCTASGGFNQVLGTLSTNTNKVTNIAVSNPTPSLGSTFNVTVTGSTGTMGSGPSDNTDQYSLSMSPAVLAAWPPSAFRLESTNLNISGDGVAAATDHANILRIANLGSTSRSYTATYTFRALGFTAGATTVQPVQEISSGSQVKHTGSYPVTLPSVASPSNTVYLDLSATPTKMNVGGGQAAYTATIHGPAEVNLDSFVLTPPAGASFVSGSAAFDGANIADPVVQGGNLVFSGPFALTGANIPLTFSLNLGATSGDRVTSVLATLGSALIGSDHSDITGAHPATATVNVDTAPSAPDFSIDVSPGQSTGVDVLSHASDADGDTLTVANVSAAMHGTATLSAGSVSYQPDGSNTSPDSFTYTVDDGRGGTAQGTVTVTVTRVAQTISFPDLSELTIGDTQTAGATSDSGLAVTYTSQTTDICSVDPDTGLVTALAAGTCTIAADQPGNDTYAAADQITSSFNVGKMTQAISADDQGSVNVSVGEVVLSASSDSGLSVTFISDTSDVCSVDSSTGVVTLLAAGTCTIEVGQPGSDDYLAATPAPVTFTVVPEAQAVSFDPPAQLLTGPDAYLLSATSSAFLPVSFTVTAGNDVCSVEGAILTVTGTGSCDVEASAAGDGWYAAATPVTHTINVVAPADDSVTLPATTGQPNPQQIDVLANDPSGSTLSEVTSAAHGMVSIDGDAVSYTPDVTFRGNDQFDYTVTGTAGRTASAHVTVHVSNAAPTASNATAQQVAGSIAHVTIDAADLNGDPLTLTVEGNPSSVPVQVNGLTVQLAPPPTLTGNVTIIVAVHDGAGGSAQATIVDTVRPRPVVWAHRTISSAGTHISWAKAAATGARYQVRIGSQVICLTSTLSCNTSRLLGPGASVWIRVIGRDATMSTQTAATPLHRGTVLVDTVYFGSAKWTLTAARRAQLVRLAKLLRRNGFTHVQLDGYTDLVHSKAHSLHLSQQRTETVARLLVRFGLTSSQSWLGMSNPAVPGRNSGKNRRVAIYVS
jgi:outer membrane protein OmpA-like peptidoglycan-associated protein